MPKSHLLLAKPSAQQHSQTDSPTERPTMLNPVYMPFAFMGGRSWAEMIACDQTKAMDSSILIGIGSVVDRKSVV